MTKKLIQEWLQFNRFVKMESTMFYEVWRNPKRKVFYILRGKSLERYDTINKGKDTVHDWSIPIISFSLINNQLALKN